MNKLYLILIMSALLSNCGGGGGSSSGVDDNNSGSGTTTTATTTTTVGGCQLSDQQQALLDAHNAARASARVCGTTSMAAAPPLEWHCLLEDAATGHSRDMADTNFFDHTGSDGLSPFDRMSNVGYDDFRAAGENIIAGFADVDVAMERWLNSPGHCSNIMSSSFTQMGGGFAENSNSQYGNYLTTNFGRPF